MSRGGMLSAVAVLATLSGCASTRPFELEETRTSDLRVLYPPESGYLVPHLARSLENSMAFQRRTFG